MFKALYYLKAFLGLDLCKALYLSFSRSRFVTSSSLLLPSFVVVVVVALLSPYTSLKTLVLSPSPWYDTIHEI